MHKIPVIAVAALISLIARAQPQSTTPLQRHVHSQTLTSKALPCADLTFAEPYRYVGGRVVNLYGKAEAEQHVFVSGPATGPVQSFYWVQFEHFLPGNQMTYDYKPERTTDMGGLEFIYDVKSFRDYPALQDPGSDGAAIAGLLARHNLAFPVNTARVRMFHLPSHDRRAELMIIYGESLPPNSAVPATRDGVRLDDAAPAAAQGILQRAKQGLSIRKH